MDKARHFKFAHRWTIAITSQRKTNEGGQGHVTHFLKFHGRGRWRCRVGKWRTKSSV